MIGEGGGGVSFIERTINGKVFVIVLSVTQISTYLIGSDSVIEILIMPKQVEEHVQTKITVTHNLKIAYTILQRKLYRISCRK